MKVVVKLETNDIYLAAAIRGLAAQIEVYQTVVRGTTMVSGRILKVETFQSWEFNFIDEGQGTLFGDVVRRYLAPEFQDKIKIEFVPKP
jgi:hypothetical protein